MNDTSYIIILVIALAWSLAWKGIAMWKAAKNDQMNWFIAILLISLVGLLEITYLMFFQKKDA